MNGIQFENKTIFPTKIVCIGRNYVEHIHELGNEVPKEPVFFFKPNSSISSQLVSNTSELIHYETELSFLIMDNELRGLSIGFDLTKREIQASLKQQGLPWERAKAFDRSAVFSNFIPLKDRAEELSFELYINDKLAQKGGSAFMIHKPEEVMRAASTFTSFEDGDIVMTGTPKGVGVLTRGDLYTGRVFTEKTLLLEKTWLVE